MPISKFSGSQKEKEILAQNHSSDLVYDLYIAHLIQIYKHD